MSRRLSITTCVIALLALTTGRVTPAAQTPPPFNFDTGAAPVEVIAPAIVQVLLQITPANDAPIILRHTTLASHAWYDALAPYHPTAVGVSSNLGRRPVNERTQRNKNIAMLYASYRLMNSLQPTFAATWRGMLTSVGLNPDDTSEDLTTAVGIGNVAGRRVVADRSRDGMNQLGDEGGTEFHRRPYADYTGYKPVNTPERLFDPSRWQPLVSTTGFGTFTSQQFITPQWGRTKAYSFTNPRRFNAPPPRDSRIENFAAYRAQAVDVLNAQASLTDDQKMLAEFFDNKLNSLGFAAFFIIQTRGLSLDDLVIYDFLGGLRWRHRHVEGEGAVRCGAAGLGDSSAVQEPPRAGMGRSRQGHRGDEGRGMAVVPEHRQPPRVPVRFGVLLRRACAGQPPLPRLRRLRAGRARGRRQLGGGARRHAGIADDGRPVEHLHGLRECLRHEPRARRRALPGGGR